MRRVRLDECKPLGEETSKKLHSNLPPGGWFPALRDLSWCITELSVLHADLFLSPHLQRISISAVWPWSNTGVPPAILPTLVSIISTKLPTSSLEKISVHGNHLTMPRDHFKASFSSIILRCGSSFTEYDSPVPLSNAAMDHLIHLSHLHTWRIHGPPPTYPTSSLPLVFPPLRKLTLGEGAACGWLPWLRRLEDGASTAQCVTPLSKAKEFLEFLEIKDVSCINIGASFVSTVRCFRNLVHLCVAVYCPGKDDKGQCIFELNNDNIAELAMTLTQLKILFLGYPCSENTCLTTVACLLPISVHCSKLEELRIHFNTTNIVDDLRNVLEGPRFQQLCSLPRCSLAFLEAYEMPLRLHESDLETVAKGMVDIFPSLIHCDGFGGGQWDELCGKIQDLERPLPVGFR